MSRIDLINAIAIGDVNRIKELKDSEIQEHKGTMIFAGENRNHTWHPILCYLGRSKNGFKEMHKYPNMSAEDFATLIVKYDLKVMDSSHGVYINTPFPVDEPDPIMTDERKYIEVLNDLKELSKRIPEIGYYDEMTKR